MAARARQQEWSREVVRTPVPDWLARLDAHDPTEAIRALGEHGAAAREAVEPLRAIMRGDPSWETRRAALEALARIEQHPETSAMLAIADPHKGVRIAASDLLARYGAAPAGTARLPLGEPVCF